MIASPPGAADIRQVVATPLGIVVAMLMAAVALAAAPCRAADPRIDPVTGRERAVYPPARHFDHLHMRLAIDIPTMAEPAFSAVETLTVAAIGSPRDTLVLRAAQLTVDSVSLGAGAGGKPLAYTHDQGVLTISFPSPVKAGDKADVVIRYHTNFGRSRGTGLTYADPDPDAESETDRAPQIHSQGQPEFNHTWFPCHDFPNEKLTTELVVTVESGFQVCSNGHLVARRRAPDGRTAWHWLQDKPHANYLVVLVVGKFSIVGLDGPSRVPCMLYAPIGTEKTAKAAYANTPAMMRFFEEYFDEPYPWDKYAQLLVREFMAGGMENTSATTMQEGSARSPPGSQDDIIAHELGHQWMADLVSYKSWEHTWLGEGWATYCEALWEEHKAGDDPARARRAYQRQISQNMGAERVNRTHAPNYPPLASPRYNTPFEVFIRPNNVYSKGGVVLHMLRMRLGDDVFREGVRRFVDRYRFDVAETDDFRRVLEDVSGLSLEKFFDQWVRRPGTPRLAVEFEWDEPASSLAVSIAQTQEINADNPAFDLVVPIELEFEGGAKRTVAVRIDSRGARQAFELPSKPTDATVDPDMTNAAWVRVTKPVAMWLRQLGHDSVFARLQAVEHLAGEDDPRALTALGALAGDANADPAVRVAAARVVAGRALHVSRAAQSVVAAAARDLAASILAP